MRPGVLVISEGSARLVREDGTTVPAAATGCGPDIAGVLLPGNASPPSGTDLPLFVTGTPSDALRRRLTPFDRLLIDEGESGSVPRLVSAGDPLAAVFADLAVGAGDVPLALPCRSDAPLLARRWAKRMDGMHRLAVRGALERAHQHLHALGIEAALILHGPAAPRHAEGWTLAQGGPGNVILLAGVLSERGARERHDLLSVPPGPVRMVILDDLTGPNFKISDLAASLSAGIRSWRLRGFQLLRDRLGDYLEPSALIEIGFSA